MTGDIPRQIKVEFIGESSICVPKHAHLIHQPTGHLNPVSSPGPFAQWGLDILGPFPRATGNRRFVLVLVPGPIFIAGQVETLHLEVRNLCPVQFLLLDRWKPSFKGQKPVPGPIIIASQVETLRLEVRNLYLVQFLLPVKWKPYF